MKQPDIVIIGSGQAGVPLATRLVAAGRRVVLVERDALGGTCVNTGCTPTKTFIASAEAAHRARKASRLGVNTGDISVDFPAVVARKRDVVETWREGVQSNLQDAGDALVLLRGDARFSGPRTVTVGGDSVSADVIIVNTGGRPAVPPIDGLDDIPWLDNARAMDLDALPSHLVVLGGGYIGCELGQAFRRFGAEVTIVDKNDHLMRREDVDVSEALEDAFREEGISLRFGARATRVERTDGGVRLYLDEGDPVDGSHLLVATGRRPSTDGLGCDAAGIDLDASGHVVVDDGYATSADGIYAVGDVTGGPQFTHVSWDDHRILFDILEGTRSGGRSGRVVPYAAFTDPPIGRVGWSEREAEESDTPYSVGTLPFKMVARAYETDRTAGLIKVVIQDGTDRILGATVVGAEAAELVTVFQALMLAGAPVTDLVRGQMIHPAFVEGLQSAVMTLPRFSLG